MNSSPSTGVFLSLSKEGTKINTPEHVPDKGELLTDEFPSETMAAYWDGQAATRFGDCVTDE